MIFALAASTGLPAPAWNPKSMKVVVPPYAAARDPSSADWARIASVTPRLKCTCESMPPGTTNLPLASSRFVASSVSAPGADSSTTRPSRTPTSARNRPAAVTTVPPVTTRSSIPTPNSGMDCPG